LPNGRGSGENINLLFELEGADIISCFAVDNEEGNLLIASKFAQGFIVPKSGVLAQTKNGKNIFNLGKGDSLKFCLNINDEDSVATYSTGGKLLVFDIAEIPVMQKGKGVILQRYTDTSKLAELKVFKAEQGLKFKTAKGEACEDCAPLKGKRAGSGGAPPLGFIKFS